MIKKNKRSSENYCGRFAPAFSDDLNVHRNKVNQLFNEILSEPEEQTQDNSEWQWAWQEKPDEEERQGRLKEHGFDAETIAARLDQTRNSHKYRHLSAHAQPRFDAIVPLFVQAAAEQPNPTDTLMRLFDFLENISRRSAYLAFLNEHPQTLAQLAQIMSQSSWVAAYLSKYPILLDELISAQLLDTAFDWQALAAALSDDLKACGGDTEAQMDTLRRFQHAQVFRLAVQDLAGLWTVESLSDQLSALADTILAAALPCAWADMPKKHRDTPQFAVVGYGKLGGKELGYASDLDLVYLYDDPHPDAGDVYSRLARRLTNWLSAATGAGSLYETDLRLRPNGDAGFLAHSIAAFEKYQRENAWTWEHQALTRSRPVAGSATLAARYTALRQEILTRPPEPNLRDNILAMRQKMHDNQPAPPEGHFHLKQDAGGLIDIEFIVQYLLLAHGAEEPVLCRMSDNIRQLAALEATGILTSSQAMTLRDSYRKLRLEVHHRQLNDTGNHAPLRDWQPLRDQVIAIWQDVFAENPTS